MSQNKKPKLLYKFIAFVAVVVLVAIALMIPPVSDKVGEWVKVPGAKIRAVAQTIVGIGIGVMLISWGIAALSLPVLGGAMIVIGLAILAYSVWPLFRSSKSSNDL